MSFFTSSREKRLWLYTLLVVLPIVLTLVFSGKLAGLLANEQVQVGVFMICMILIGSAIIIHALHTQPSKTELAIWVGLVAVYLLLFIRVGNAEHRTHLMEYGVLAIFVHRAFIERYRLRNQWLKPALLAFAMTLSLGVLDECVQHVIPSRVFDLNDMLFNGFAAFVAIGTSIMLQLVRKRMKER